MSKILMSIDLDPSKDIAKLPSGAIARGVVANGENITAVFEVDTSASPKAVEFKYPSPGEAEDIDGFTFCGTAVFNEGATIVAVYSRELI